MKRHAKNDMIVGQLCNSVGERWVLSRERYHNKKSKNSDANLRETKAKTNGTKNENAPLYCGYFLHRRMATCEAMKPDKMEVAG